MADLSRVQTRQTDQNRLTNNRDSILPNRRDTEAPQRRVFADIRGTVPGDNGAAEQLQRILGLTNKAAASFQDYANAKHDKREEELGSQGLIDAAAGMEDPELIRTSQAYRASATTYDAQKAFFQSAEDLDDKLKQTIFEQQDAAPEVRVAEINKVINDHYKELLVDPETGKVRDFGSPQAAKWLAAKIGEHRAEVTSRAFQMVEDRMAEDSITKAADAFAAAAKAGQPIGFEDVMSNLLPTVDRKKAKQAILVRAEGVADELTMEGEDLLETDPDAAQEKFTQARHIVANLRGSRIPGDKGLENPQAAPADPLAPLPEGQAPAGPAPKLVIPFEGFEAKPVSKMGAPREGGSSHNGEDFPAPIGTVIKAPGNGTVIASFRNQRGGNQVRVKMDDGSIVGFAHLSVRSVQEGQRIDAGRQLGLSGNTGRVRSSHGGDGAHVHMTVEVDGKKVSPSEFFKNGGAQRMASAVPEDVLSPQSAASIAAHSPNTSGVRAPSGAYSLNPEERAHLAEFDRRLRDRVNSATEAAREKRQTANALQFAMRLAGMGGTEPTMSEITQAVNGGVISASNGISLINTSQANLREARAEVLAERAAEKGAETESKVGEVDRVANGILGDLYSGKLNAVTAQQRLLNEVTPQKVPDRETRQAIIREVTQGISAQVDLRNASPEYRRSMATFDQWEAQYLAGVKRSKIGKDDRGREAQIIKTYLDAYRVRLSQYAALPPEKVAAFMEQAEKNLDRDIMRRFPPRTSANSSSANAYTR